MKPIGYTSFRTHLLFLFLFLFGSAAAQAQCTAPTGSASYFTSSSAVVSWNAVSGATGYEYAVSTASVAPASGTPTTNTFVQFTGLNSGTSYYAFIRTICSTGASSWNTVPFATLVSTCPAVTGLAASSITATTAYLSWNVGTSTTGYEWVLDQSSANPSGFGTFTSVENVSLTSLIPSTTYYFHVRNNCGGGNYSPWAAIPFTTLAGSGGCAAPTGVTAGPVTSSTAYIAWNAVSGAISYQYIVDQSSASPTIAGTSTTTASANVTGLSGGTVYYVHVRSQCTSTSFSAWTTATFTTTQAVCFGPASISASAITGTTATISWPAASGVTTYEYIITSSSALPTTPGTTTTALTANITGLTPGNTYYAFVRSVCSSTNFSSWMYAPFTTTGTSTCAAPTGLTASGVTSSSANFNWTAVPGAIGYEYVIDFTSGPPLSAPTAVSTNSLNLNSLASGTSFYIHVRTQCSATSSSAWTETQFTTLMPGCFAPGNLAAGGVTATGATISWIASGSATSGYEYVVNTSSANPTGAGTATSALSVNVSSLTPGTTYYAHVRSNCGGGSFSTWISVSFVTTSAGCVAPAGVATTNVTATTASISWGTVAGAAGYEYVVNTTAGNPTGAGIATTSNSTIISGLSPSTLYYVHARTKCSATNFSTWSTSPAFTTQSTTSISGIDNEGAAVVVYPNPVRNTLNITMKEQVKDATISVTDISGRVMYYTGNLQKEARIDMTEFPSGIYIVKYVDDQHSETVKITKE